MRLIGDIHGKLEQYKEICRDAPGDSIQLGDFGIGFDPLKEFELSAAMFYEQSGRRHLALRGNHDCLDDFKKLKFWIPDGTVKGDKMFVGGADSIDKDYRTIGVNWWENEQLTHSQMNDMINRYEETKPRIMITHDCPYFLYEHMFKYKMKTSSITNMGFDVMFNIHQPKIWVFGHHHKTMKYHYKDCEFICLDELDYIDLDKEWN